MRATGVKGAVDSTTTYYYCNRSGYFTSRGGRKRYVKSQGSSKLDTYCTAARAKHDGEVEVQHCPTHYGHSMLLGHLRITESDRLAIAGKCLQGIPFERTLDDIRNSMDSSIQRIHLTTRKDIANIERAYGLQEAYYHKDDVTSIMAWVEDMKKNSPNPVLLHKQQGVPATTECQHLEENDICRAPAPQHGAYPTEQIMVPCVTSSKQYKRTYSWM